MVRWEWTQPTHSDGTRGPEDGFDELQDTLVPNREDTFGRRNAQKKYVVDINVLHLLGELNCLQTEKQNPWIARRGGRGRERRVDDTSFISTGMDVYGIR